MIQERFLGGLPAVLTPRRTQDDVRKGTILPRSRICLIAGAFLDLRISCYWKPILVCWAPKCSHGTLGVVHTMTQPQHPESYIFLGTDQALTLAWGCFAARYALDSIYGRRFAR